MGESGVARWQPAALTKATRTTVSAIDDERVTDITPHSTIVSCEACTSNGLNSPVRPYLSVAVTVYRMIPIGVSCGTTHFAAQDSRSGRAARARQRLGTAM